MSGHHPGELSDRQAAIIGTPQPDERVLWKGEPKVGPLARSAFHVTKVGTYFAIIAVLALALGSVGGALAAFGAGALACGLLYGIAYLCTRTTSYVLTDQRLILRIGMAVEKTVNLPLKYIGAAHLTDRGAGVGDIAMELMGEHKVGYLLLWPHARPWKYSRAQPMLRAIPDAANVAQILASAVGAHEAIERDEKVKVEQGKGKPQAAAPTPSRPQAEPAPSEGALA